MKKTSKFLLAAAMAMSTVSTPLAVMMTNTPVFAAGNTTTSSNPSITITKPVKGVTYTAYQIFTGTLASDKKTLSNIQWGKDVTDDGKKALGNLLSVAAVEDGGIPEAADIAAAITEQNKSAVAAELLKDRNLNTSVSDGQVVKTPDNGDDVIISDLTNGYYLVTDDGVDKNHSAPILKVIGPVEMQPKATTAPNYEKKVKENVKENLDKNEKQPVLVTDKTMNDVADYDIGDTIPFQIAAQVPTNLATSDEYTLKLVDKMEKGLTLNQDSLVVKIDGKTIYVKNSDGSINNPNSLNLEVIEPTETSGHSFSVKIPVKAPKEGTNDPFVEYTVINNSASEGDPEKHKISEGSVITVEFTSKLNESAKLNKGGNENAYYLVYGNNSEVDAEEEGHKTPDDKVVVFTYTADVKKVDSKDKATPLTGAKFILKKVKTAATQDTPATYYVAELEAVADSESKNTNGNIYRFKEWKEESDTFKGTEVEVSSADSTKGLCQIQGLDDGTYYLQETQAPDGYNLPSTLFEVKLTANTQNNQNYTGDPNPGVAIPNISQDKDGLQNSFTIENTKGSALPETGGMGTTMLYTVGAVLAGGAAVLLITNKRVKRED